MSALGAVAGAQRMLARLSVTAPLKPTISSSAAAFRQSTLTRSFVTAKTTCLRSARSCQSILRPAYSSSLSVQFREFSAKGKKSKKKDEDNPNDTAQHQEWIDFQKSIAVQGFETGQTTEIRKVSKRSGRRFSRRKSKEEIAIEERMAERQRLTDIGGGEYPPLRYSDLETERLLAQAYAAIPPRAGKRGTRQIKRQKRRWWLVRQIRKKYKKERIRHHFRTMFERSRRVRLVKEVLKEAPQVRKKDREYQLQVLRRWMATMHPDKLPVEEKAQIASSADAN